MSIESKFLCGLALKVQIVHDACNRCKYGTEV
jgi:hypothetical protein